MLSCSSNNLAVDESSRIHRNDDDLREQLRKILAWRKNQMACLNKDNRRAIQQFVTTDSENRTKMTMDRFQQILDILDLKIVLIPR
jgi:hypothetical protein